MFGYPSGDAWVVAEIIESVSFFCCPDGLEVVSEAHGLYVTIVNAVLEPLFVSHRISLRCSAIHAATGAATPFPHCLYRVESVLVLPSAR
jgi:hypothetical protein